MASTPECSKNSVANFAGMENVDQKATLQQYLGEGRQALRWKLEGLGEYDIRRPMIPSQDDYPQLGNGQALSACRGSPAISASPSPIPSPSRCPGWRTLRALTPSSRPLRTSPRADMIGPLRACLRPYGCHDRPVRSTSHAVSQCPLVGRTRGHPAQDSRAHALLETHPPCRPRRHRPRAGGWRRPAIMPGDSIAWRHKSPRMVGGTTTSRSKQPPRRPLRPETPGLE